LIVVFFILCLTVKGKRVN